MKLTLSRALLFGVFAASLAAGAPAFTEYGELKTGGDGLQYAGEADEPFTGVTIEYYPDGTKRNLYTWEAGRKNGLHIIWHEGTGRKKLEGNYANDLEDGVSLKWHPDGRLKSYGVFQLGKKQGLFVTWHASGHWATADYYEDGQQVGLATEADSDGTLLKELLYQEGKFVKPPTSKHGG